MVKESARKGSHCGNNNAHNARTCSEKVVKLFGVKISKENCDDEYMQKSSSMGNLNSCTDDKSGGDRGYVSDGHVQSGSDGRKRKKGGTPWTEEEHKTFLDGLEKLGKGDWRGISREFVTTKTPTQVASHAQKYFIRQATPTVRKRRSSLFDLPTKPPPQIFPAFPQGTSDRFPHQQVSPSINLATQLAARPMPAATRSIPNFHGIPYMARNMGGRLSYVGTRFYPALSFVPMMNFPNGGYVYVPNGPNSIPTSSVAPAHSSQINPPGRKIGSPSTMETDLELSLAAPQTSNPGGSIVVI